MTIAVTGANGNVGSRVARRLAGGDIRLLVRDAAKAPAVEGAEIAVIGSYGDFAGIRAALDGARSLFFVSAHESEDRLDQHKALVDAARDARVRHVVYLSFMGAAPDAVFTFAREHYETEQYLRDSGIAFTSLRDASYADSMDHLVGDDGVIRGCAGDGRIAAVAWDDIADAAVAVLRDPAPHAGAIYTLTGPEALTLDEIAAELSKATGRDIRYEPETLEEAYASRRAAGLPEWLVEAFVSSYLAFAAGELATVTGDVEKLTGHPATPLAEVLRK